MSEKSVNSESELLAIRAGIWNYHSQLDQGTTVCANHRYSYGIYWKPSNKCGFPGHPLDSKCKPQRGMTVRMCVLAQLGWGKLCRLGTESVPAQSTYMQGDLARTFLHTTYEAHNAMEDVKILGQLISHTKMDAKEIAAHSFPPSAVHNQLRFNREKTKNVKSLHPLVGNGVLKMGTAEKVAGSGLNLTHLKKIFERGGEDGLRNIFSCKNCDGLPRVTNTKKL